MAEHSDSGLFALTEDLREAMNRDGLVDLEAAAKEHQVERGDVERCVAALDLLNRALATDFAEPTEASRPKLPADYELLEELGRGGMGIVYRARQRSLDREVAVKVMRPGELIFGKAMRRFEREAKSLAKLRHPHIVGIHEVGQAGDNLFFTMDLIEGSRLSDLIKAGRMTPTRAVRLLRQVASAIAYTHAHGLIHRDLKPANILVTKDGVAQVVDFGLARSVDRGGDLTASGFLLGTPAYMSPEQARGDHDQVGEASDIYAMGVILYECLTGQPPFTGGLAETLFGVLSAEVIPPHRIKGNVPRVLETICLKAMARDPNRRYRTAIALSEDLKNFEEGRPICARGPGVVARLKSGARRKRQSLRSWRKRLGRKLA